MIDNLRALVREDLAAVQTLIIEKTQSNIALIEQLAAHIIQSGGKQLRPLLLLLASHATGYQGQAHIQFAAMLEFFHTATLLHDDVVDESALRRGKETANHIWGNKASILVGDYLFIQYIQLMVEAGDLKAMQILTDMAQAIGRGEIKQLSNQHDASLTEEDYYDIIHAKTSCLFATAARLGARVSQTDDATEHALHTYGLHLGNAFQLVDDALDYCSDADTLGKNIGDDLANGKTTMPLIYALKQGSPSEQANIRAAIEDGALDALPSILKAIESTQAIEYTKTRAAQEVKQAIAALTILPDSVYKTALVHLAEYAVARKS